MMHIRSPRSSVSVVVVSSLAPKDLFLSMNKEKTVFDLITRKNNTIRLSKTVFGLPIVVTAIIGATS